MSIYRAPDLKEVILGLFHKECSPVHRYASFDYCYNYFQGLTADELEKDIEKSCLELSFYLASWGMLRGSSFLLQKSVKYYEPLIRYFIKLKRDNHKIWQIDADSYSRANIQVILDVYDQVRNIIIDNENNNRHIVLITKIMLGVFGCIPAFDQYFTNTFRNICKSLPGRNGFRSVNKNSLGHIKKFYEANKEEIDKLHNMIHTLDFTTGKPTRRKYSRAKIIDMYGFAKEYNKSI